MPLQPLPDWIETLPAGPGPGNPDLEYEPEFMALVQAAQGRPETQFSAAEPPAWLPVREAAEALMPRTRDLRIALLWCRAIVHLEGLPALPAALALLHGLLDLCWDGLNPRPEPGDDAFVRLAALAGMDTPAGLAGDVRRALLVDDRRLPGLTVRDCEIALDMRSPRPDEHRHSPANITGALAGAPDLATPLSDSLAESLVRLDALDALLQRRFGDLEPPQTSTLRAMLTAVQSLLPAGSTAPPLPDAPDTAARVPAGVGAIESRQDVLRALEQACAYLDRHEPTNPAQWLLRRAAQLIGMDFLQLVSVLAPDASADVRKLFGAEPSGGQGDPGQ